MDIDEKKTKKTYVFMSKGTHIACLNLNLQQHQSVST